MQRIYLDNNASTPLDPRLGTFLQQDLKNLIGNPSSTHYYGQQARSLLINARTSIAAFLQTRPEEIVFTSGGTEGANMVIRGLFGLNPSGHLITGRAEHSCVLATAQLLESSGCEVSYLTPGLWGAVRAETVREAIRPDTKLIALMAVNNETGVKTDIEAIAAIAQEARIPFLVDGVALFGKEFFKIPSGVSAMFFSGHKFHAPQGVGMAFIRSNLKLQPLLSGGEQEFSHRGGTENMLGILAMAKAIDFLKAELSEASQRMARLRDRFEVNLKQSLKNVSVNGLGPRVVNTSNLAFSGVDGETLLMSLDMEGVAASHGSACSSGALEPSRILLSMGLPLEDVRSSIRFSFSRMTTEQEIDDATKIIIGLVKRMSATT